VRNAQCENLDGRGRNDANSITPHSLSLSIRYVALPNEKYFLITIRKHAVLLAHGRLIIKLSSAQWTRTVTAVVTMMSDVCRGRANKGYTYIRCDSQSCPRNVFIITLFAIYRSFPNNDNAIVRRLPATIRTERQNGNPSGACRFIRQF